MSAHSKRIRRSLALVAASLGPARIDLTGDFTADELDDLERVAVEHGLRVVRGTGSTYTVLRSGGAS